MFVQCFLNKHIPYTLQCSLYLHLWCGQISSTRSDMTRDVNFSIDPPLPITGRQGEYNYICWSFLSCNSKLESWVPILQTQVIKLEAVTAIGVWAYIPRKARGRKRLLVLGVNSSQIWGQCLTRLIRSRHVSIVSKVKEAAGVVAHACNLISASRGRLIAVTLRPTWSP